MARTRSARSSRVPSEVSVRMYNVGFGDCFLLTFAYPPSAGSGDRLERHLLVDFGSTGRAPRGPSMGDVADLVREHSGGQVDVVVATHRHKDHISGFGGADTDAVMDALAPSQVIRPWTDDPAIAADAQTPDQLDPQSTRFVRLLAEREAWMRELAETAVDASSGARHRTAKLAEGQLPNRAAIDRLDGWAAPGRGIYVKAGDVVEPEALPGVRLAILGPPTLLQVPGLASQAFTSPEFWAGASGVPVLSGAARSAEALSDAYRALAQPDGYGEARWLLNRLAGDQPELLFNVVRSFDDALNNTSIIMLVTVGSRSLLLSGDAQIENWSHCLGVMGRGNAAGRRLTADLADVDLYKVGHHGSRNATPQSLFKLWDTGGGRKANRPPLMTMLSTLPGKHGDTVDTAVPKQKLVDALGRVSTLVTSTALPDDTAFAHVTAHTTGADGFAVV